MLVRACVRGVTVIAWVVISEISSIIRPASIEKTHRKVPPGYFTRMYTSRRSDMRSLFIDNNCNARVLYSVVMFIHTSYLLYTCRGGRDILYQQELNVLTGVFFPNDLP